MRGHFRRHSKKSSGHGGLAPAAKHIQVGSDCFFVGPLPNSHTHTRHRERSSMGSSEACKSQQAPTKHLGAHENTHKPRGREQGRSSARGALKER